MNLGELKREVEFIELLQEAHNLLLLTMLNAAVHKGPTDDECRRIRAWNDRLKEMDII